LKIIPPDVIRDSAVSGDGELSDAHLRAQEQPALPPHTTAYRETWNWPCCETQACRDYITQSLALVQNAKNSPLGITFKGDMTEALKMNQQAISTQMSLETDPKQSARAAQAWTTDTGIGKNSQHVGMSVRELTRPRVIKARLM